MKKPVLVLFFVGGVTFMEIAALNLLIKKSSFPNEILCCTSKVVIKLKSTYATEFISIITVGQ